MPPEIDLSKKSALSIRPSTVSNPPHLDLHHLILTYLNPVGFEVLTAMSTKMAVFWVAAPCNLVEVYQRFRDPCYLHQKGSP
jgi:hypothetical protein